MASPNDTADQVDTPGYLAIDLGQSRVAAAVVDADGEVVVRDRITTPARNVWPAVVQLVGRVLAANQTRVTPTVCGVTCPGPIDRGTGAMKPPGLEAWYDFPLRRELASTTGLAVCIDTAGRGLAMAELWCGEAAQLAPDQQQFATLALGDEVDGAVVADGRLLEGLTGNLGQFGHLIVEPDGTTCACGVEGCLSAYAGARGITASTGRDLRRTPPAIVERTGIMTARACASIAAMLDVADIVIGGVVPTVLGAPFFDALDTELDHRIGLDHLDHLRVRGLGASRIGPLMAAAAVARYAAEHDDDHLDTTSSAASAPASSSGSTER